MEARFQSCALIGHFAEARIAESAAAALAALTRRGVKVLVAADEAGDIGGGARAVPRADLARQADFMIAVGGDGTLLQAARLVAGREVPLLGINRGRLGFLTDVMPEDIAAGIDAVLDGHCAADARRLLEARLSRAEAGSARLLALNDIVLLRRETGRMLDFQTRVDGRYLNSHRGDGMVIATATGSTAYALSCGGPIVDPRLDVLVMAPICPHTLSDRPIVVPGDARIEISSLDRGAGLAEVTCDGATLGDLQPGDKLEVSAAGGSIILLHPPGYDYFRLLRSKLRWGRGPDQPER
ncbi:MAG TPA: NAD(+)/NADH kinase [Steroidobacteraceae bacterium]|nr:NAD(+)/NADH kinase [Steroidobacteraceae bacterium]